jgi:hypothetical protein
MNIVELLLPKKLALDRFRIAIRLSEAARSVSLFSPSCRRSDASCAFLRSLTPLPPFLLSWRLGFSVRASRFRCTRLNCRIIGRKAGIGELLAFADKKSLGLMIRICRRIH